mgnify:CR=1 FL=1
MFLLYLNAYHAHDDNDAYFYLLFTLLLTVTLVQPRRVQCYGLIIATVNDSVNNK